MKVNYKIEAAGNGKYIVVDNFHYLNVICFLRTNDINFMKSWTSIGVWKIKSLKN